jgi:4-hydroxy-tetrahydrodipicolinate synthase
VNALPPPRGIITVLNTPFTASDDVSIDALQQHVSYALDAGVSGFLVPAMASEVDKLTVTERIHVVRAVLEAVDNQVPVFAGTGGSSVSRSKRLLRDYLDLGCQHVLFQIPYRNSDQFESDFLALAGLGPEVIMLQDWDEAGYGLPERLILALFQKVDAFKCLKIETRPAGVKYSRVLELTGGQLHVSGGWAVTQMIEGLRRGVHAFMPTGMHYVYTQIFRDYMAGRQKKAKTLFERILPVISFTNQHLDVSIHFFKRLLHYQGIYETPRVREPILPFDDVHREITENLIGRVVDLEDEIKSKRV